MRKGNKSILFVDNESSMCQLIQDELTQFGYTVMTQASSREALAMFLKAPNQYDLVMADLTMPHMTGLMLSQKLLGIRPDIPIVLSAGLDQAFPDEHLKAIGVQARLLKPFTVSEVANTIRRVLECAYGERWLRNMS